MQVAYLIPVLYADYNTVSHFFTPVNASTHVIRIGTILVHKSWHPQPPIAKANLKLPVQSTQQPTKKNPLNHFKMVKPITGVRVPQNDLDQSFTAALMVSEFGVKAQ